MIKVINLSNGHYCPNIKPTIFPDKTSQVWKLPEELLIRSSKFKIVWHFESEAEVIQLLQLSNLLYNVGTVVELFIPYFPYARQDKRISNDATFAQSTIIDLLETYFECGITVFDIHNPSVCSTHNIVNITPEKYIVKALIKSQADLICSPDKSTATRFPELMETIIAEKTRNQSTGEITGHQILETNHTIEGKNILICYDIFDGGATFISVAKMLHEKGAANIDVYVSHGIFSKGVSLPMELGKIRKFYTTDSYLPSREMFKKHNNITVFKLNE